MIARARLLSVVAMLVAGALGVISSTQTWLVAILADGTRHELPVAGADAIPVLAPLSLAVLALGLALSIVGTVLRYVFGALSVAAGVILLLLTGQVALVRPVAAVVSTVTDATGIAGESAVAGLLADVVATPWPAITLAGWILLSGAGLVTLATARRWRGSGRKYRTEARAPASGPLDAVDSWDGLSRGEDPTAGGAPR